MVLILMYRRMSGSTEKNPTTSKPNAAKPTSFEAFTVVISYISLNQIPARILPRSASN